MDSRKNSKFSVVLLKPATTTTTGVCRELNKTSPLAGHRSRRRSAGPPQYRQRPGLPSEEAGRYLRHLQPTTTSAMVQLAIPSTRLDTAPRIRRLASLFKNKACGGLICCIRAVAFENQKAGEMAVFACRREPRAMQDTLATLPPRPPHLRRPTRTQSRGCSQVQATARPPPPLPKLP